ncbi:MAG: AAA family ATPase [Bacteroidales bacterium]|nr:AAA family ATPase [Bacteroidales bacterium]
MKYKKKYASFNFNIDQVAKDSLNMGFPQFLLTAMINSSANKNTIASYLTHVVTTAQLISPIKSHSIAPIRTEPQRTYDQATDAFNPAGDHIPFLLARLLSQKETSIERNKLLSSIRKFGNESGLFNNLLIKRLGKIHVDPFQLIIETPGTSTNLIDVGYGVSQSLPVIVQSILEQSDSYLLLQQPEVHLHPKAQAALGTFFVDMVVNESKSFLIETHSDYIIDRIRQEVAIGRIRKDFVQILFLEKKRTKTNIHLLDLDEKGNILNAPQTYRKFFIDEEIRTLTRSAK